MLDTCAELDAERGAAPVHDEDELAGRRRLCRGRQRARPSWCAPLLHRALRWRRWGGARPITIRAAPRSAELTRLSIRSLALYGGIVRGFGGGGARLARRAGAALYPARP